MLNFLKSFESTVRKHAQERAAEEAAKKIESTKDAASAYAASVVRMLLPGEED